MENEDVILKDSQIRIKMNWKHYLTIALVAIGCFIGSLFIYSQDWIYATQVFVLSATLVYVSFIDIELHMAPDWVTFLILVINIPSIIRLIIAKNYLSLFDMLVGGLVCFIPLILGSVLTKGGIGGADVKIMGAIGLFLGTYKSIFALIGGLLFSVIFSLVLISAKKMDKKQKLPLLPYFTLSTLISILVPQFVSWITPIVAI